MPAPSPIYLVSADPIALAAGTAKSVVELAVPSTQNGIVPVSWWVEFDGVSATAVPVKVEVGRFSAAVTTATTVTPVSVNLGASAVAAKTVAKTNATAEGAGTADAVEVHRVPPTSGILVQEPLGNEWFVPGGGFFRIRLTAAATVNAAVGCKFSE